MLIIFSHAYLSLKCLFNVLPILLFFLIEFESSLYILITSPLSDVICKYFLSICFPILLTVSFEEQDILILMKSNLSVFLWIVVLV